MNQTNMYIITQITLIFLIQQISYFPVSTRICSNQVRTGPFRLPDTKPPNMTIQRTTKIFRVDTVTEQTKVSIGYRSYWKSYCYNGGALDGNSGCYDSITQDLPRIGELQEWTDKNQCKARNDCYDCWGRDADQCNSLEDRPTTWYKGKELIKSSNNNHFAHHTCNLSWRCGVHTSTWPTFLIEENGDVFTYIVSKNNTALVLKGQYFQKFDDYALYAPTAGKFKSEYRHLACFEEEKVTCYDNITGHLIDLDMMKTHCFGETCYTAVQQLKKWKTPKDVITVNLKAASIKDLRDSVEKEFLLSEELRYNFMLVQKELFETRKTLSAVIKSLAKIDDRLIGEVVGKPARTKFLSSDTYLMSPCTGETKVDSNCHNNLTYQDGRWIPLLDVSKCISFNQSKVLNFWNDTSLWLPDLVKTEAIGVVGDQEGWSFYAQEKDSLREALSITSNMGKGTSLGDVLGLPPGSLLNLIGGAHIMIIIFVVIAIILITLVLKICKKLYC